MKKVINICFLWMCQLALFGQARIGDNPDYNPTNPGDPEIVRTYKFSTSVTPENAGGTNFSGTTRYVEGASINIQAYNNTGYQFVYWLLDDSVISTSASFTYTMPAKDVTITGVFEYNPSNPSNPGKNSWNEATGEVLIDDFTAGSLYSAITSAIGGGSSYRQKVTQITVSGKMSSSDVSVAGNFSNCTLLDLKRTYGYADVPDYAYDYNTSLTSIVLPASIENIGYRAFYQAVNLADVTCYAITPPTVENDAFNGIAEGAVLHVLSAAIPLYAEAEGWKDFTILPLIEEVQALEVNLPAGSEDGRYKNMTLELVNAESGQRQKYVISDRVTYTFDALQKNNIFNVYVTNSQNVVLGKIENIVIEDKDVAVTFESLLQPQDVTLKVQTSDGTDVTSQTQIRWFDSADYLQQGNRLAGFLAGTAVRYHITLPQTLGMQYVLPADSVFTIQEGGNALVCTLQPLDEVTISGRVKDATTGGTLSGAVVSVSQKLNGLYSKAFTIKTDNKGEFTAKVFNDQSLITVSATDYLNQTLEFANFNDVTFVGEVALENNAGVTITTNLTYTTSVAEGETAEVQNWYADYANVAYEIYNETQQRAITQFDVQYPSIVLQEEVAEGDLLTLTASSRTNSFAPVKATITISAQMREEVTFNIVELGGIKASFTSTDNTSVVGILYDSKGQFVKRYTYGNASLSISDLLDGNYTLVTMTESKQFNSILNLSQFAASGLKEGVDYVQDEVTVKSGVVTTISNDLIPVLDESKFYYTGDNTLFSVNKTSIIVGSYLTLRGKIDFKSAYASQVSNVSMVVDLPESCTFVENSVMVGSGIASYTLDGNRLTIPLTDKSTDLVRFCIIPTVGGSYAPNAFAQFALDGEEVLQPIGNANFAVENLTLSVPSMVAETAVPIRGMALGNSTIEIFDNGVKIGETTSLANGLWNAVCELNEPYNLSTHSIYAKVTTKQGVELLSETQECMYDKNTIEVKTVTMINISHRVGDYYEEKTVFDFQNPSTSIPAYWYWPDYPEFTFLIDFTDNDTTKISNVVLYVKTTEDNKVPLKASYDEKKNLWVTSGEFGNWSNYDIPVSVAVDFDFPNNRMCDSMTYVNALSKGYSIFSIQNVEKNGNVYSYTIEPRERNLGVHCVSLRTGINDTEYLKQIAIQSGFEEQGIISSNSCKFYATKNNAFQLIKETNDSIFLFATFAYEDSVSFANYRSNLLMESQKNYQLKGQITRAFFFEPGEDHISPSTDRLNQWRDMIIQDAIDEANQKLKCADYETNIRLHEAVMRLRQCVGFSFGSFLAHSINLTNTASGKPEHKVEYLLQARDTYDSASSFGSEMENISNAGQEWLRIIREAPSCSDDDEECPECGNKPCTCDEVCPRCGKDPCECEDECPECGNMPCTCDEVCSKCGQNPCVCDEDKCPICGMNYCEHFQPPYVDPVHDPSGFVYEGVSSNRLEGVMASCYYKETVEDMYGDLHENVVLWDAEQYAQENPLFTDENGMYRWDVPQGLWQVKFEKEGYQTTYSEWLPVPPPQLEVNIAMTQNKQPEVKAARAYEDGIEVEFDKYMQLDRLTTENIFVTKNDETVAGTVTLLNEEQAYEDNSTTYASKVRFVPETSFLTTDEVLLTVSRKVKSYAGIQMESDYTQSFDIEKEVKSIVADSLIKVAYNGDKEITVSALPYDAAIGKKMIVKNSSSIITSVSADTLTLDENGQAALTLNGDLPGTAMLTFTLADADVQASSTVQVVSPELLMTASPKATRASGTAVYRGTEVGLTCATEGAVIYYTLDGSCPCDENALRMIYEHPIAINEDMTIKAMAVVEDREESDVAEFSFTIKTTNLGMNLKKGWNWVSHNMETEIPTSVLPQNATRIVGQTAELIKDPAYGLLGNLKTLQPTEAYKVQMDDNFTYAMSGYEFNPATVISLRSGWNWLGFPVSQTMSLNEAFANMQPDNEDYIVGQDGFAQYADGVWTGTLQTLNPGMGYLYHSQNDKAFAYNRAIVSKARSVYGRGIKNETPWTVDKNKYPNVMSMIADLHVNGQKTAAGNYAVGAFCGTECRGVGKYVNGKLMISIYGNGNEKITFRAMNNETEEMFDIVEQTIFAETLLGSLYKPYTLNIGGATSVSEIGTNWKVWPTVATDNLYLSLDGKIFDRVTLTDVYGHVALVKENVADGEAIRIGSLADGVYIITAIQGGDTYYKKIVKAGK